MNYEDEKNCEERINETSKKSSVHTSIRSVFSRSASRLFGYFSSSTSSIASEKQEEGIETAEKVNYRYPLLCQPLYTSKLNQYLYI